jgi:putative ABC transport system permease protein
MTIFQISLKNLLAKALTNSLSILLMALGVGIITLILGISTQLDEKFTNNIKGIDMVIGAKGSPLQLILASVYQIDAPTGNINYQEAKNMSRNPFIKSAIPISMGDSYLGARIVGSDSSYLFHYKAVVESGKIFTKPMDCVIGNVLARRLGLKVGSRLESAHGLDNEGEKHNQATYLVTGILKYNKSVIDELIITPLESVWNVHQHADDQPNAFDLLEEENEESDKSHNKTSQEITAMLVKFRNPMGLMTIPRNINANSTMQAALPAIEINRLFAIMGVGIDTLKWIAFLIIFVAGLSVLISLYNSLKERKYEMALMLTMGASRLKLFLLLLFEGLFIGIIGYIIGHIFAKLGLYLIGLSDNSFQYQFQIFNITSDDLLIFLACIFIGFLAAAIPSLGIYKINISKTLSQQ